MQRVPCASMAAFLTDGLFQRELKRRRVFPLLFVAEFDRYQAQALQPSPVSRDVEQKIPLSPQKGAPAPKLSGH